MIARDWVSHSVPSPSSAHSMSCGAPKCASTRRPSSTSSRTCRSVRQPPAAGPGGDRASVDHPVVGVDRAGDDGVAEARGGVEHAAGAPTADRVGGEQHARGLRVDHPLHHHGELGARVRDARVGAVGHGPVRPERRPAAAHRVEHGVDADHVEVGVLLTREARAREVLGRGRRPHRDRHRLAEREVGGGDRGGDVVGDGRGEQGVAGPDREVGGVQQRGDARRCRRPARTPGCPRRSRRAPGSPRRAAPRG